MIGPHRVVAMIPARGGSKSVPLKNIRALGGKPLLVWSIEAAQQTPDIDEVIVSTDSDAIASVARGCGAAVLQRPAHLATDDALVIDAVRDLLMRVEADVLVLLEPTCPFRLPQDITACLEHLGRESLDSVATFTEAEVNPHRTWRLEGGVPTPFIGGAIPWLPRQALPKAYQLNGAVYACRVSSFPEQGAAMLYGRQGAVVMPAERSVDLDSELDFAVAEQLLRTNA